jgi:CheY-like chemotaxis protein
VKQVRPVFGQPQTLLALQHEKADAFISDILMPHMDGYTLSQLRRPKSAALVEESLVMREYNGVLVRKL